MGERIIDHVTVHRIFSIYLDSFHGKRYIEKDIALFEIIYSYSSPDLHFYVPLLWLWSLNLDLAQLVENANIWLAVNWDISISENPVAYLVDLTWVKRIFTVLNFILCWNYTLIHTFTCTGKDTKLLSLIVIEGG